MTATLAADWSAWGEAEAAPDPPRPCGPRWLPGNREWALKTWFPGPGTGFSRVYREVQREGVGGQGVGGQGREGGMLQGVGGQVTPNVKCWLQVLFCLLTLPPVVLRKREPKPRAA